jgi:transcription initiation factor TFIIB
MLLRRDLLENPERSECLLCRGKIVLDYETCERVCSSCGLVTGQEGPNLQDAKFSLPRFDQSELSYKVNPWASQTQIDLRNVDSNGRKIINKEELDIIRKLDRFTANSGSEHRNVTKALSEITRIAEQLGIGATATQEACSIYVKAFRLGLIRGRSIFGIGTATVYLACRKHGIPRSIEEIADYSQNEDSREVAAYCKLLIRRLGIDLSQPNVQAHIAQIARNAGLNPLTQRRALSILTAIENSPSLSGKRPISLAAAALYLASRATGEGKSQLRIAGAANLTPTTIRKSSLEMERLLEQTTKPANDQVENRPNSSWANDVEGQQLS